MAIRLPGGVPPKQIGAGSYPPARTGELTTGKGKQDGNVRVDIIGGQKKLNGGNYVYEDAIIVDEYGNPYTAASKAELEAKIAEMEAQRAQMEADHAAAIEAERIAREEGLKFGSEDDIKRYIDDAINKSDENAKKLLEEYKKAQRSGTFVKMTGKLYEDGKNLIKWAANTKAGKWILATGGTYAFVKTLELLFPGITGSFGTALGEGWKKFTKGLGIENSDSNDNTDAQPVVYPLVVGETDYWTPKADTVKVNP